MICFYILKRKKAYEMRISDWSSGVCSSDLARRINTTRWGRTQQDYLLTAFMGSTANLVTPDIDDPSTWTINRSIPTFKDNRNEILTNQTSLTARFDTKSEERRAAKEFVSRCRSRRTP